jgi:TolA-binding protein
MRHAVLPLVLLLASAPVQCTKKYDPADRREDTAGDGLYALAEDFKAKGNREAQITTLRFLITRYPSSRRAARAREELAEMEGDKGAAK